MPGTIARSGPVLNQHATSHGVYGYLATGRLPPKCEHVRRMMAQFRRELETSVSDRHGAITLTRAALVQSCIRHETRCQLLLRWLRTADGELTTDQRLTILRDLGKATSDRDAVLRQLDLDSEQVMDLQAIIADVHREQTTQNRAGRDGDGQDDPSIGGDTKDAPEGKPESEGGVNNGD